MYGWNGIEGRSGGWGWLVVFIIDKGMGKGGWRDAVSRNLYIFHCH